MLIRKGSTNVRDVRTQEKDHPFANLYARRGNGTYIINVVTRNKCGNDKVRNPRYKLVDNAEQKSKEAEKKYEATAAWITVAVDIPNDSFSAYFGLLSDLEGNKGVPMMGSDTVEYEYIK